MARGDGVKKLGDLFETYRKRLVAPQKSVIDTFVGVVDDLLGIEIQAKDVSYTPYTRTLSLRSSGQIKTEVLLAKEEILTHMKGRIGTRSVPDDII